MYKGFELDNIEENMTLNIKNLRYTRQLTVLFDIMKTDKGEEMTVGGWEVSGVSKAIKIGLSKLQTLRHFKDIFIIKGSVDFQVRKSYSGDENQYVNTSDKETNENSH